MLEQGDTPASEHAGTGAQDGEVTCDAASCRQRAKHSLKVPAGVDAEEPTCGLEAPNRLAVASADACGRHPHEGAVYVRGEADGHP
jgi:hypothetical protein